MFSGKRKKRASKTTPIPRYDPSADKEVPSLSPKPVPELGAPNPPGEAAREETEEAPMKIEQNSPFRPPRRN